MIPKNNNLVERAGGLRRNMTRHERTLWYDFLKTYPVKIYKQRVIGNYIVDFYCHSARIAIELDGSQHYEDDSIEYDILRTKFLNEYGIDVMRFLNMEIDKNFEGVYMMIDKKIKEKINNVKI